MDSLEKRVEAISELAKSYEKRNQNLEDSVAQIKLRNDRVEAGKAWEGSWFRKGLIALLTYLLIAAYFYFVLNIDPWLNALVPTVGFLLSTLTLSFVKDYWIKNIYKN